MTGLFAHHFAARGGSSLVSHRDGAGVETAQGRGFEPSVRRFPGATFFKLTSRRIRDAFAAEAAEDGAGDWPPASDCWPMEIVSGQASFHIRKDIR